MNYNFYAGPSAIDNAVLKHTIELISKNYGISLLEISHRSDRIQALFNDTKALFKTISGLNDDYDILFLHGGASLQFAMIPYNYLNNNIGCYIDTGRWSDKALTEANMIGQAQCIASSKQTGYNHIPIDYTIPSNAAYLHITSNNTVMGTQYKSYPKVSVPLIADMSSDIFSRKVNYQQFDLIYAGLQKNLGTAGGTLVAVKKNSLPQLSHKLPSMLNYRVHIDKETMFNTPPVFAVLFTYATLTWLKNLGGIDAIAHINEQKANLLYSEIDRNPLFNCPVNPADRSDMNPVFDAINENVETNFTQFCKQHKILGIKGHRSRGGFRASLYNAVPLSNVEYLVDCLKTFERQF